MPQYTIKIENLAEIKAAFKKSPEKMLKNLTKAIAKSTLQIERESKGYTPVDTGYLRASHRVTLEPLRGEVQPMADYAFFVHEGTRYQSAQPFLAEGVASSEENVKEYFTKAVQDTLDEIARSAR